MRNWKKMFVKKKTKKDNLNPDHLDIAQAPVMAGQQ